MCPNLNVSNKTLLPAHNSIAPTPGINLRPKLESKTQFCKKKMKPTTNPNEQEDALSADLSPADSDMLMHSKISPASLKEKHKQGRWSPQEDAALYRAVTKLLINLRKDPGNNVNDSTTGITAIFPLNVDKGKSASTDKDCEVRGTGNSVDIELTEDDLANVNISFSEVVKGIPGRTAKQAQERWENHLRPTLKRGEWSYEETYLLLDLMSKHGQDWSFICKFLPQRGFHGIKVKGRSLLKETMPKRKRKGNANSSSQTNNKASGSAGRSKMWSQSERKQLLELHKLYGTNVDLITAKLTVLRPVAEVDRELLSTCNCVSCVARLAKLNATGLALKISWSMEMSEKLKNDFALENGKLVQVKHDDKCSIPCVRESTGEKALDGDDELAEAVSEIFSTPVADTPMIEFTLNDGLPSQCQPERSNSRIKLTNQQSLLSLLNDEFLDELANEEGKADQKVRSTDDYETKSKRVRSCDHIVNKCMSRISSFSSTSESLDDVDTISLYTTENFPTLDRMASNNYNTFEKPQHHVNAISNNTRCRCKRPRAEFRRSEQVKELLSTCYTGGYKTAPAACFNKRDNRGDLCLYRKLDNFDLTESEEFKQMIQEFAKMGVTSFSETFGLFPQRDLTRWLNSSKLFGNCSLTNPGLGYILKAKLSGGYVDPRYDLDFLFPTQEECKFDPSKPLGVLAFQYATCLCLDSDASAREALGNVQGRHWFTMQASPLNAFYLLGNFFPKLMRNGTVWCRQIFLKQDGRVGVFLANIDFNYFCKGSCRFRLQDISDQFPKIITMPPDL